MKLILYQATIAITKIDFGPGPFRCQIELGHLGPLFTRSLKVEFTLGTNDDGTKYKGKIPPLGA